MWSALIVTLATGGIILTSIFSQDFVPAGEIIAHEWLLIATWSSLGLAAIVGVLFLGVITARLSLGQDSDLDVYSPSLRIMGIIQFGSFLAGIAFLIIFASTNLLSTRILSAVG